MAQLLQPLQYGTSLWTLGDGVFYPPGNDQVQATRMARGPGDELDTICGRTLNQVRQVLDIRSAKKASSAR